MITIEGRRQNLVPTCIGQQVTSNLPCYKLVIRQIFVERANNPIPPWPHRSIPVVLISISVCIASDVQPIRRPLFTKRWPRQIVINHQLVGVGPFVRQETVNLDQTRRQPCQIKRDASYERLSISWRIGRQAFRAQSLTNKGINRIALGNTMRIRRHNVSRFLERPVLIEFPAFCNPPAKQCLLRSS